MMYRIRHSLWHLLKEMACNVPVFLWREPDDVSQCRLMPLAKLDDGLFKLHSAHDHVVLWLTNLRKNFGCGDV